MKINKFEKELKRRRNIKRWIVISTLVTIYLMYNINSLEKDNKSLRIKSKNAAIFAIDKETEQQETIRKLKAGTE